MGNFYKVYGVHERQYTVYTRMKPPELDKFAPITALLALFKWCIPSRNLFIGNHLNPAMELLVVLCPL